MPADIHSDSRSSKMMMPPAGHLDGAPNGDGGGGGGERAARRKRQQLHGEGGEESLPEIVTKQGTVRVKAGDTARLRCQVTNLGRFVVMWKEGKRVITAGTLKVRGDDTRHQEPVLKTS